MHTTSLVESLKKIECNSILGLRVSHTQKCIDVSVVSEGSSDDIEAAMTATMATQKLRLN